MDVLTCIRKYSEEDIKMMIKKITEATDDEMGFYMDALELLKNTLAENKYTLFVYVPEDENELMNINLFDTDEIVEKYHPIRQLDCEILVSLFESRTERMQDRFQPEDDIGLDIVQFEPAAFRLAEVQ